MKSLKRNWFIKLSFFTLLLLAYYILTRNDGFHSSVSNDGKTYNVSEPTTLKKQSSNSITPKFQEMVIAVVACGDRLDETLTMLKSSLLFSSKNPLRFVIIADDGLILNFKEKLAEWQQTLNGTFKYEVLNLNFPEKNAEEWRKLFKPCASQRLFLPAILTHIDSLIYVDTDTLFLSSVESLWKHFNDFNSTHMAALALEHEDPNVSWYSRFAEHPYYGKLGVNSGVMLMNLTRMRAFHWGEYVASVYNRWRTQLTWGDQDIINIIFHYHSEMLYLLDCDANFRPDQCAYGPACKTAFKTGARVLHGSRGVFHSKRQPAFSAVHKAMEQYRLGTDPVKNFLNPLSLNLRNAPESNCGKLQEAFVTIPQQYFGKIDLE